MGETEKKGWILKVYRGRRRKLLRKKVSKKNKYDSKRKQIIHQKNKLVFQLTSSDKGLSALN